MLVFLLACSPSEVQTTDDTMKAGNSATTDSNNANAEPAEGSTIVCDDGDHNESYVVVFPKMIEVKTKPPALTILYEYDQNYIDFYNDNLSSMGYEYPKFSVSHDYSLDVNGHIQILCTWTDASAQYPDGFVGFPFERVTMWVE